MPAALLSLAAAGLLASQTPPSVEATSLRGAAPLQVTLSAAPGASSYRWTFGDGTTADGRVVEHVFGAGEWTATVTADGATTSVLIRAYAITLAGPAKARFDRRVVFRGSATPRLAGVPVVLLRRGAAVTRGRTRADGTFALGARAAVAGPWRVEVDGMSSADVSTRLLPKLSTGLTGSGVVRRKLELRARLQPAEAGAVRVQVWRGKALVLDRVEAAGQGRYRVRLDTARVGTLRLRVSVVAADGYGGAVHVERAIVGLPHLRMGSSGAAVRQLTARLRQLHYAVPVTPRFEGRVLDAVYAFQKVQGLPRTGAVDARFWRRLQSPRRQSPRYRSPASHLEIDKTRQVLLVVRRSRVSLIVPVSTGGYGAFTPVGRFSIFRKVGGFDPSPLGTLYAPMYFTGGYAIHGNPSVPPYPVSHGCIRVPMWVAAHLYDINPYGSIVYVY